tara:strand:+ start:180 stop:329 length:150 start_codon:yes stop_codon:yes gene_type:complete
MALDREAQRKIGGKDRGESSGGISEIKSRQQKLGPALRSPISELAIGNN